MKKVDTVIFDFNGTLFWDSDLHEKAWKSFGKKLLGRDRTDEEFNTYFHGRTNKDTLEYSCKDKYLRNIAKINFELN